MSAPLLLCLLCALGNCCCAAGSQISGLSNSSTAPFCWQASSSFVLPPLEGASASQSYKLVQPAWSCLAEHWHKNGEHSLMQDVQ